MEDITSRLDALVASEREQELMHSTGTAARKARYRARRNSKVNECPNGHEYTVENTHINSAGRRVCLTCHRARRVHLDRPAGRRHRNGKPGVKAIDLTVTTPDVSDGLFLDTSDNR